MNDGFLLSSPVIKRITAAVKRIEGQIKSTAPPRGRWQKGGGGSLAWGRNDGICLAGDSGTATLYETGTTVGTETEEFTRYDTNSGLTVADGARVLLGYVAGEWTLLWSDSICPDPEP